MSAPQSTPARGHPLHTHRECYAVAERLTEGLESADEKWRTMHQECLPPQQVTPSRARPMA